MFKQFTLEEIYEYTAKKGFSKEEVKKEYDEYNETYIVWFGKSYVKTWTWEFDNGLKEKSTDYECEEWED